MAGACLQIGSDQEPNSSLAGTRWPVNPRGKHLVGLLAEFRWPATILLGVRDSVTG
jgi:hypothetical protein